MMLNNIKTDFETENKNMLWEFAKCKLRTETMLYSSKKAKKTRQKQLELEIARYILHLSTCFCACAQKQRIPLVVLFLYSQIIFARSCNLEGHVT